MTGPLTHSPYLLQPTRTEAECRIVEALRECLAVLSIEHVQFAVKSHGWLHADVMHARDSALAALAEYDTDGGA